MLTITNEDNMDLMARYPDNYFDLAIVDPPYGLGEDGSRNSSRGSKCKAKNYKPFFGNDKNSPDKTYFDELKRVSKNQIIWGANHFITKINCDSSSWIVWDKDNGLTDFADCELAYTSFKNAVRKFKYKWQGMLQENMKNKEIRIHPTQKPVALYKWILDNYAKSGDKILDTHLGSGSIAIACHDYGFDLTACELDQEYFNKAIQRIKNHTNQLNLFK
jgi:site-specific DNA-methyltransferase (adenine-specific)